MIKDTNYGTGKRVLLTRGMNKFQPQDTSSWQKELKNDNSGFDDAPIDNLVKGSLALRSFLWALHSEPRILIIKELAESPKNVKELSLVLNELHSVISFHLRHLRNNEIVDFSQDGKERVYKLSDKFKKLIDPIIELNGKMNYSKLKRRNQK